MRRKKGFAGVFIGWKRVIDIVAQRHRGINLL